MISNWLKYYTLCLQTSDRQEAVEALLPSTDQESLGVPIDLSGLSHASPTEV